MSIQAANNYWLDYFKKTNINSEICIKKSKNINVDFKLDEFAFDVDQELFSKIQSLAAKLGIDTKIIIFGAWAFLLSRYTNHDDVVTRSDLTSSQTKIDLPYLIQINASETIEAYLQRLSKEILLTKNYLKTFVPTDSLTDNMYEHAIYFNDIKINNNISLYIDVQISQTLRLKCFFNKNNYTLINIKNLSLYLNNLLNAFTLNTDQRLVESQLLTPNALQEILFDWNNKRSTLSNETIIQMIDHQVAKTPDAPAVAFNHITLSYKEFNAKVNQLSYALIDQGIHPNDKVAICIERSLEFILCVFAVLKAGAAYIPLDPTQPKDRLEFILNDVKPALLITNTNNYQINNMISYADLEKSAVQKIKENPLPLAKPEDIMYVMYTSGTTGKPKGVPITHQNAMNFFEYMRVTFPMTVGDAEIFKCNTMFDVSGMEIFPPLHTGAKLVILEANEQHNLQKIVSLIDKHNVSHIFFVPSVLEMLLELANENELQILKRLKVLYCGGEKLTLKLTHLLQKVFSNNTKIINWYGPTETTIFVSFMDLAGYRENASPPIGKPITNVQMYILNKHLQICPPDIEGELCIGGANTAKGYLNRPDENTKKFIQNPFATNNGEKIYKSGDLCTYLSDGNIKYIDRIDFQIKLNGFRIELEEIASNLMNYPNINNAVAILHTDEQNQKFIVAYYVTNDKTQTVTIDDLKNHLKEFLPVYMIPAMFIRLDAIPINQNGKLDRKSLPKPTHEHKHLNDSVNTDMEKRLIDVFASVFKISKDEISKSDTYLTLGGSSLSVMRLLYKIQHELNKNISITDLYTMTSIESLAQSLQYVDSNKAEEIQNVDPMKLTSIPLTSSQVGFWLIEKFSENKTGASVADRKRFKGIIDIEALKYAFSSLIKRHPFLVYAVSGKKPLLNKSDASTINLDVRSLESKDLTAQEDELLKSFDELSFGISWFNHPSLLIARVFNLADDSFEIQLSLPHLILDGVSLNVLWSELNTYYHQYNSDNCSSDNITPEYESVKLSFLEDDRLTKSYNQLKNFWTNYFEQTYFLQLVPASFLKTQYSSELIESTRMEVSDTILAKLCDYAKANQTTPHILLNCLIAKAVVNFSQPQPKEFALGYIKSTRDREKWDDAIGNFIRLDLIKINPTCVNDIKTLLADYQLQMNIIGSNQSCPDGIKYHGIAKKYLARRPIKRIFVNILSRILSQPNKMIQNSKRFLNLFWTNVLTPKGKFSVFPIVNIWDDFFYKSKPSAYFGSKPIAAPPYFKNQIAPQQKRKGSDNFFIIQLIREPHTQIAYITIDSNLQATMNSKICAGIYAEIRKIVD